MYSLKFKKIMFITSNLSFIEINKHYFYFFKIHRMKKIIILLLILTTNIGFCQMNYKEVWSSLIPMYDKPIKPFTASRKVLSTPFVAEVNKNNGNLYVVSEKFDEIIEYNSKNSKSKLYYKFPHKDNGTQITQIKFDSKNNLIITGKTITSGLYTTNAFSKEIDSNFNNGYTFVTKINNDGTLAWFTYFYEIPANSQALTIDNEDNIYILNTQLNTNTLKPCHFQPTGDLSTHTKYQDVITKLNPDGTHVWSTFYVKDQSKINAILAASNGIYVYGMHLANTNKSTYFGTEGSFLPVTSSNINSTASIFISKFSFDGNRLWSSYFGNVKTFVPFSFDNINQNPANMTVIGDDVYFICLHNNSILNNMKNLATAKTLLETPPYELENHTLTKFNSKGERVFTTYLPFYGFLYNSLDNNSLFLSTTVNNKNLNLPVIENKKALQQNHGGLNDVYTYLLSVDGTKQLYNTFLGYEANETGFSIPTLNGFYTIGHASNYQSEKSPFASKKDSISTFTPDSFGSYKGNFIRFFKSK